MFAAVAPCVAAQQTRSGDDAGKSLFAQSAGEVLQREFGNGAASYLLLDAKSGTLLASRWDNYEQPIPVGSLVKPFTALAYASEHDFRYPSYECRGKANGCWQPRAHGTLQITAAVAVSCNAYFRRLAQGVALPHVDAVAANYGLELPDGNSTSVNLIGIGDAWRISPLRLAQAYLELYRRKESPGVAPLLEGMRESALFGTGAAVGRQLKHSTVLVKTGTAPCTHTPGAPADGFVLTLAPADAPEILLLIRVHGVAGAKAAETAGRVLREMEE